MQRNFFAVIKRILNSPGDFVHYFSASTLSSILNYGINAFFALALGVEGYAELTVALLIGFFISSVSELGINQYYLARFGKHYVVTLKYFLARIFVASVGVCLIAEMATTAIAVEGLLALSASQILIHTASSTAERLDAFKVVSRSIYFHTPIRLSMLFVFFFADSQSYIAAINYYVAANVLCGLLTTFLLIKETGLYLTKISVPERTSEDPIDKRFVVPAFFIFLIFGRLDVIYFDILKHSSELRDYYFYVYGLIFPMNQFFQVVSKYTFVKFQRYGKGTDAQRFLPILKCSAVITLGSLGCFEMFDWSYGLTISKVMIVGYLIIAFICSGVSAIFAIGIYTTDNGFSLFRLAVSQFCLANCIVLLNPIDMALALAAAQALANMWGTWVVLSEYRAYKAGSHLSRGV